MPHTQLRDFAQHTVSFAPNAAPWTQVTLDASNSAIPSAMILEVLGEEGRGQRPRLRRMGVVNKFVNFPPFHGPRQRTGQPQPDGNRGGSPPGFCANSVATTRRSRTPSR